jgi:tricorn protease
LDGGGITAPRYGLFNPDSGEFDVENHGISPDIEVELDPALVRRGHDPQLERAVAVALEQLQQHPIAPVKRPKYPIYNWSQIRSQAAEANPPAAQK